jgi:hypothetical protein
MRRRKRLIIELCEGRILCDAAQDDDQFTNYSDVGDVVPTDPPADPPDDGDGDDGGDDPGPPDDGDGGRPPYVPLDPVPIGPSGPGF